MIREVITHEEARDLYKDCYRYGQNCTSDEYDDSPEFEDDLYDFYYDELRNDYFCQAFEDRELITRSKLTDMYNKMLVDRYPELLNEYYASISGQYYCEESQTIPREVINTIAKK